jgi:hypothetical protein
MPHTWLLWDCELAYTRTSLNSPAVSALAAADGAEPLWGVYETRSDGLNHMHAFPHSTFEWRAAEYGFDVDDVDGMLDVILHEPFLPDPDDPLARMDPVLSKILDDTHGMPGVWTPGVPAAERRAAHLERVAAVKKHHVQLRDAPLKDRAGALEFVGSARVAPTHPLEPIKSQTRLDPVRVQGRRLAVDWLRANTDRLAAPARETKPPSTFIGAR